MSGFRLMPDDVRPCPVRITEADSSIIEAVDVNPQTIDDIPDDEALSKEVNAMNLGGRPSTEAGIPDMDDIPDMEEDDLEGSSAAVVAKPAAPPV